MDMSTGSVTVAARAWTFSMSVSATFSASNTRESGMSRVVLACAVGAVEPDDHAPDG